MKKNLFFTFILLFQASIILAQNLQLHYDMRHTLHGNVAPRNYLTATFEMFKPDKWGSTFMFVDMDFNQSNGNIGLAYTEIARDQKIGKSPIMAHIEFNGGIGKDNLTAFSIHNAYLLGGSYAKRLGNVNLSTYLAYKYNAFNTTSNDIQWTAIWSAHLYNKKNYPFRIS